MSKNFQIVVFAGPSGGHLFPAVAFGETLRKRFPKGVFELVTGERAKKISSRFDSKIFNKLTYLHDFPFPTKCDRRIFRFAINFFLAFIRSWKIITNAKPDLCVGFGSYISYPGIVLARWMKIPTLIHEQNRVAGKSTRQLLTFADAVAVTFEETLKDILKSKLKVFTGLPMRSRLYEAAREKCSIASAGALFEILVVGGSQGAHGLNQVVLETFSCLTDEEKNQIAVIHITGEKDWPLVTQKYQELKMHFKTYPFFDKMEALYQQANLAITRAGANTLFELAVFRIPAIVVPYPYAEGHQLENANVFAKHQAIVLKEESQLSCVWLLDQVRFFKSNSECRDALSKAMAELAIMNASDLLVDLAEKVVKGKYP